MTLQHIIKGPWADTRRRSVRLIVVAAAGVSGVAMASLAGLAAAASPSTITTAANSTLGETVVVDSRGLTVYELRPETADRLLCKKGNGCFQIWRPVTVRSPKTKLTAARGITGKLRILHRDGIFQVTLSGHPLYRFAGDASKRGAANGQGLRSFHGTWHVVATSQTSTPVTTPTIPTTPTMTTPTTTTPTTPTVPYYPPLPLY